MSSVRAVSLWMDQLEEPLVARLPADQRRASFDLLQGIPDEVKSVLDREGIDCDYRKGGVLYCAARYPEQEASLRSWLDTLYTRGLSYLFSELFPQVKNARVTHTWGGNLGMSRRFKPHMLCDRANGIALSDGYGGEGVGASNLGGRTLADLILKRDTGLVRQPWVITDGGLDALKAWGPEPCRWLGYNAIIRSFVHEDRTLANPHTAPWRRKLASGLAGFMESLMQ